MSNEASPIAEAELKHHEANRSEQLPAGAQWELQVMKPSGAIAQNGSKNLSPLLFGGGMKPTLLKEGENSG